MTAADNIEGVRYEPNDHCPPSLLLGVGLQGVAFTLPTIVLVVAVTARAGGQGDDYVSWAVFAALIIAGALIALQASRVWRFGAGHIVLMGPSPNFVAVSVLALEAGGPALLASLAVAAAFCYLMLALWLPMLRRIITPVVSGTALMLIAVSVMPVALDRIQEVPDGTPPTAGPIIALVTVVVSTVLAVRAPRNWRPWSPLIILGAGCVVAAILGAYDFQPMVNAAWAGIPGGGLQGLDLSFGLDFWALLPAFVVVTLVGGVKNMGDSIAVQQVSRRRPKVTDFRLVQGALNTNGLGILLSGIFGTPPTTVYSSLSVSLISLTSVAARRVGYVIGATLALLALFPKVVAVFVSIPNAVMGAYLLTAVGTLFVSGVRTLVKDGLDAQKALVVALAFSIGAGLEQREIFAELFGGRWGPLLDNGVVAGAVAAVVMTLFIESANPMRQARLEVDLSVSSLHQIDEFLCEVASKIEWSDASTRRLRSAGEETLMSLVEPGDSAMRDGEPGENAAGLIVVVRPADGVVEMEFLAVFDEENLEDRLAYLSEEVEGVQGLEAGEISLRLLRHYASSVHHQKYYGLDVVTVQVRGSR